MRTVVWSPGARHALLDIVRYISKDDARSADRVKQRISDAGNRLGVSATGRPGRIAGFYEKSVPNAPYILLYAMPTQTTLLILDVVHTSRDWRKGAWPPKP